ncbi:MAG: SAM-dependent methyltransferase [Chlamydiae bacterium CG10_big_fil_rev_8_21_14_0_10_35_9]|nr:MAG: SAM-dependent methyltransferase [Chlamydiae bacterium CG10_big_fil_rev_8_21_14_0_10_35_9]
MKDTSFEKSSKWYTSCVGKTGHYYHKNVILPHLLQLDTYTAKSKILDIACGQGILERALPKQVQYVGLDLSKQLVKFAEKMKIAKHHLFLEADAIKEWPLKDKDFTHAFIILALQNIEQGEKVIKNASKHLLKNGKLTIVLNHPAFRIPRQSAWEEDTQKRLQYRRVDLYMSPLKIPIVTTPHRGEKSAVTYSFHHPISTYFNWFHQNGFCVENISELCSDKKSSGKKAKMENRARKEFPLFMTIVARKK